MPQRGRADPSRGSIGEGMSRAYSNIVLIGMPGAGKSTVGVLLAKRTGRGFLDTDVLIQTEQGRTLQDIVDADGYIVLRRIEEATLLGLSLRNHVIATGGSAVYSAPAMAHLQAEGLVVFLSLDLSVLTARIGDFSTRGLAKRPEQDLAGLFAERLGLYTTYADVVIDCQGLTPEQVCDRIVAVASAAG